MKVVIMGCGRVGAALAADLDREGNEVLVLDTDSAAFRFLPDDFSGTTFVGSGIDIDTLRKIGVDKVDVFVSATRGDNRNVMAAQMARHIFGVKVVASRVFDPLREEMYRYMGVRTINPTRVQAKRLKRIIEAPSDEESINIAREFLAQDGE
jgi:trk system potassium uptake protein TrkA